MANSNRYFIIPANDAEAILIAEVLRKNGENFSVTSQAWGASWGGLEDEIKTKISNLTAVRERRAGGMVMGVSRDCTVYGVELQGQAPEGCENIDHHIYDGDDRSDPKSSLEQVADLIGYRLNRWEELVAANDRGFIPMMEVIGATADEIQRVRALDRRAQGIQSVQEFQAEEAIASAEVVGRNYFVRMAHSKCATVTDRLYGRYDNLLILAGDGESDFYGQAAICTALKEKFGGWVGGALESGNGFWGGYADQGEVEKTVKELLG